ncbi:MAG: hypothetical protein M3159_08400 [Actinomycetota bacterium]|nr:hypothetical protein [Actinomycetota bacterium]
MAGAGSSDVREYAYWGVSAAAIILVVVDIFVRGAEWTTLLIFVLIAIGMFLRPGGVWKR